MHMVTETYQLRDGEKLTEFYNGIDWESLFEFVRHYYGIGVEQMPTTCLKPNGRMLISQREPRTFLTNLLKSSVPTSRKIKSILKRIACI